MPFGPETSILTLSCCLSLLLSLDAGLLIVLSFSCLGHNTGTGAFTLESLESILQRLIFANANLGHRTHLANQWKRKKLFRFFRLSNYTIILSVCQQGCTYFLCIFFNVRIFGIPSITPHFTAQPLKPFQCSSQPALGVLISFMNGRPPKT